MGGFCLVVKFLSGGSSTDRAIESILTKAKNIFRVDHSGCIQLPVKYVIRLMVYTCQRGEQKYSLKY